jgi:hypothetical protein
MNLRLFQPGHNATAGGGYAWSHGVNVLLNVGSTDRGKSCGLHRAGSLRVLSDRGLREKAVRPMGRSSMSPDRQGAHGEYPQLRCLPSWCSSLSVQVPRPSAQREAVVSGKGEDLGLVGCGLRPIAENAAGHSHAPRLSPVHQAIRNYGSNEGFAPIGREPPGRWRAAIPVHGTRRSPLPLTLEWSNASSLRQCTTNTVTVK